MKHLPRLFTALLCLALLCPCALSAAVPSHLTAYAREYASAEQWMLRKAAQAGRADGFAPQFELKAKNDYILVFSDTRSACFIVMAQHRYWPHIGNPVLAYSLDSYYNLSDYSIFDTYSLQLRHLTSASTPLVLSGLPYRPQLAQRRPLLGATTWGQGAPYNTQSVKKGSKRTIVGCVPVAVAQVMHAYRFPAHATGIIHYEDPVTGKLSWLDVAEWMPDWNETADSYTPEQEYDAREVAKLMTLAGMGLNAKFGVNGTSASLSNVKSLLCTTFGYSGRIHHYQEDIPDTLRLALIYRELDEQRPCLVSTGEHTYVIDGYDGDFLHCNWGWCGGGNGYFRHLLARNLADRNLLSIKDFITGIEPMREPYGLDVTLTAPCLIAQVLTPLQHEITTALVIRGPIDGRDLRLLRKMAGGDEETSLREWRGGNLIDLDLSQAVLTRTAYPNYRERASDIFTVTDGYGRSTRYDLSGYMSPYQWQAFCDAFGSSETPGYRYVRDDDGYCYKAYFPETDMLPAAAFKDCSSLQRLILPDGLREIGPWAMMRCACLREITLPESVRQVHLQSFSWCTRLEKVNGGSRANWESPNLQDCSPVAPKLTN